VGRKAFHTLFHICFTEKFDLQNWGNINLFLFHWGSLFLSWRVDFYFFLINGDNPCVCSALKRPSTMFMFCGKSPFILKRSENTAKSESLQIVTCEMASSKTTALEGLNTWKRNKAPTSHLSDIKLKTRNNVFLTEII